MLSLLFNGAEGSTLDELKSVLHFKDEISFNNELKALIILLSDIKNNELQITNTAYVQEGIEIMDDFLTIYTHTYSNNFISFLSYIDFEYIDNAQYINYAIQVITNNKISDVILPEYINDDTKFVLVNTVYFKPRWLDIFDEKDTKEHMFHVSKTQKYFVPTMFKNSIYKYGIIESWRCSFIEIPYLASNNCHFKSFHE
ncbi:Antichymotrypsin-2 [Camponotus floridanus]|uniref:Antichymotrypsin-2 n=1 Tax=Camponotus floridanus TaxID=104421 RepID=E1ZVE0_CAMFO|nr:Antichymotrypsin-2 [Camponotus floridanus]